MSQRDRWVSPLDAFFSLESALSNFSGTGNRRQKMEHLGLVWSAIWRYCPSQYRDRIDFIQGLFTKCYVETRTGSYQDFSKITAKELRRLKVNIIFLYTSCVLDMNEDQLIGQGRALQVLAETQERGLDPKAQLRKDNRHD